jgi:hypothetical protein
LLDLTADFLVIAGGELAARRLYPVAGARGDRSRNCAENVSRNGIAATW